MQSFLTILIAGLTAFMAMFMLQTEPAPQVDAFAADIDPIQLVDELVVPSFLIEPSPPLVLALDAEFTMDTGLDLTGVMLASN
ncbi:MAG: hypothetical protein AAF582_06765 [Pseudomonadota bacterium]